MKKSKKKCFTVELSNSLYVFAKEVSSHLRMPVDEFIQKLVEEELKTAKKSQVFPGHYSSAQ